MTTPATARQTDAPADEGQVHGRTGGRTVPRPGGGRLLGGLASGAHCLFVWTGTASGHGDVGLGGAPVAFPVALWVPAIAGLVGGVAVVIYRNHDALDVDHHGGSSAFGLLLVGLGGTFAITALTNRPLLGGSGGCIGALAAFWVAAGDGERRWNPGHHGDLTLGSVCIHRLLEGLSIGALYTASARLGTVGVTGIAVHAAIETGAVAGLYAPRRVRAVGAILIVQVGYAIGAGTGIDAGVSVPESVQIASIGALAGILLVAGVVEMRRPPSAIESGRIPG